MAEAEPDIDLIAWIEDASRRAEPAFAIVSGSTLDDWLVHLLKSNMRQLSSTMAERLFEGYGPLSTFAAKIDVAYAFGYFGQDIYNDLRAIKDIRNTFAHATDYLHFNSPELEQDIKRLTGWTKNCDPQKLFSQRINACVEAFKPYIDRADLIKALMSYRAPSSSPGKSGE
jgi:DNA-binding MltR family transcriptional regulator